jgi:hypothetical protein
VETDIEKLSVKGAAEDFHSLSKDSRQSWLRN